MLKQIRNRVQMNGLDVKLQSKRRGEITKGLSGGELEGDEGVGDDGGGELQVLLYPKTA